MGIRLMLKRKTKYNFMKNLLIIPFLFFNFYTYSQCETNKTTLDDGKKVISMTEKFYQNNDLENGAKTFYVSTNNFIFSQDESILDIAVTYISTRSSYWIIPNSLKIGLISGREIILKAKEKSSQTLNRIKPIPSISKGIECYFQVEYGDLLALLDADKITYLKVSDYKTGQTFDITPNYKGQLNEMIKCVMKYK